MSPSSYVSSVTVERIATRLLALEKKTAAVVEAEFKMTGEGRLRWRLISKTTPSGKNLFVCMSCGRVTPAPSDCREPVKLWDGRERSCQEWVPPPAHGRHG